MKMSLHIVGTKEELQQVLAAVGSKSTPETRAIVKSVIEEKKKKLKTYEQWLKENRLKDNRFIPLWQRVSAKRGPGLRNWKRKEISYLRSAATTTTVENMAKTLGRSEMGVLGQLKRKGLYHKYIRAKHAREYNAMPAVIQRVRAVKRVKRGAIRKWTYAEDQQVRQFHGKMSNEDIAKRINRTRGAVEQRAFHLKVTKPGKTPAYKSAGNTIESPPPLRHE